MKKKCSNSTGENPKWKRKKREFKFCSFAGLRNDIFGWETEGRKREKGKVVLRRRLGIRARSKAISKSQKKKMGSIIKSRERKQNGARNGQVLLHYYYLLCFTAHKFAILKEEPPSRRF